MELEKIIRDTLTHFIQSHIPAADLSGMDDVFFSYITGVLEELGLPESSEETFDMDTFVEMMEAYIPGFAEIHSGDVCEMMFSLSESLGEARNKEKPGQKAVESGSETPSEDLTKGQEPEAGACNGERLRTPTDGAGAQELARPRRTPNHEELKQVILQKYMMVDSADDQKTHRPAPPKEVRAAVPAHQQFVLWLQGLKNQAASPKSNGAGQRQDCSQSLLISKKGILAKVLQGLSVPTIPD
ncbi:CUE domain-containing protein 2 isoform X3 [Haliaeetus albicilla]|uniref:CUE domain-containing protein 2 isoform X3 n=1 Tax=Haliaeetus albicilla TaxID=8969 RepID=UPI0037E6FBC6